MRSRQEDPLLVGQGLKGSHGGGEWVRAFSPLGGVKDPQRAVVHTGSGNRIPLPADSCWIAACKRGGGGRQPLGGPFALTGPALTSSVPVFPDPLLKQTGDSPR